MQLKLPKLWQVIIALIVVAGTTGTASASNPSSAVVISAAPGAQTRPRTDGTTVVWIDHRTGDPQNGDIYAANMGDRREFPVATGPADQSMADVDGGIVVWQETAGPCPPACDRNIRGKDLATGRTFDVAATAADEAFPAIANNGVVWIEGNPATQKFSVKLRDLRTMAEPITVAEVPAGVGIEPPAIYGDRNGWQIVWIEQSGSGRDARWRMRLYLRPFASPSATLQIAEGAGTDYGYDLRADAIIHARPDGLFVYDLRMGYPSSTLQARQAPYLQAPTFADQFFFWIEQGAGQRFDLRGMGGGADVFDVSAGVGNSMSPRARGGLLVWSRDTGDGGDIYAIRVVDALPTGRRAPPTTTSADLRYFSETGHNLAFGFKAFWELSGGLPVFGYPLSEEFGEFNIDLQRTFTTQYFERQRYEYHPENAGTPYTVLLGRLGPQLLEQQGRYWYMLPKADPRTPHYFAETGQAIAPQFWDYWRTHGLEFGDPGVSARESLALFGYPITPAQMERNPDGDMVLTQWFERARFEYHPNNPDPYKVLLGRLGAELLTQRGWLAK